MAEAQEKRPTLLDLWRNPSADASVRFFDQVGKRGPALNQRAQEALGPDRIYVATGDSDACNAAVIEALLDKLDKAKTERDEAIDDRAEALSEQARAEASRDEARESVARLAREVANMTGREASRQSMQNDLAWVPVEVERLLREAKLNDMLRDRAERERDEARAEVERESTGRRRAVELASQIQNERDASRAASQREQARANAAEMRVAELEAEVERLRKERTDAERTAVDEAQAANKAIGRVAELEKAAQEAVRCWHNDGSIPLPDALDRLQDLVGWVDPEDSGDQPTSAPTDIPTWLHDLEKRVTADLNGLRDRLARLEARNG